MKSNGTTINHFHEKLLLLKDRMNTATGKAMAQERHKFMESYLQRFMEEWGGGGWQCQHGKFTGHNSG